MKNKIFSIISVAAFALVVALNINANISNNAKNNVALANVEALAMGEGVGSKACWKTITSKEGSQVLYCATCTWISGTYSWISGSGTC